MTLLWIWAVALATVCLVCAAEPEATTKACSTVLAALGTWLLWAVTQVRDNCHRVVARMLDHRQREDEPVLEVPLPTEPTEATGAAVAAPAHPYDPLEHGSWIGATLLSRVINLVLAVAILLGLLSLDFLRAALVTLGVAAALPLVPPAVAMGLLFAALPAFFGGLLLESLNITPRNAHLFSGLEYNPQAKRLFDWGVRVGCVLTLCLEVFVFVDSWLMLQHAHSPLLEVLMNAITGVLVILAGLPVFWCLILGVSALVALLLVLVWLLAAGLALVLRGVHEVTSLLAEHVVPRLVRVLALPGTVLRRLLIRLPGARALLRAPRVPEEEDEDGVAVGGRQVLVAAEEQPPLPAPVSMVHRASYLFVDEGGRRLMEPLLANVGGLGGKGSVDEAGYSSLRRRPERSMHGLIARLGGRDISPDPRELAHALEMARTPDGADELVVRMSCEKLVAHLPPKGTNDPIVVVLDLAQVLHSAAAFDLLHQQVPRQPIVLVVDVSTRLTSQADARTVRTVLRELRQLLQRHSILCSILYDGRESPLAQEIGQQRQLGMLGKTVAGLLLAHKHAPQNETAVEALALLCKEAPFLSLAIGSTALLPGTALARLDPGRWATRAAPVGRGDLDSTRVRMLDLLARVQMERTYHTLAVPAGAAWGRTLAICIYPFRLRDERFQDEAEALERAIGSALPGSRSLMISGNGCWDGGVGTRYFGQIGLLQGWDMPTEWLRLAPDESQAAHDSRNGHQLHDHPNAEREDADLADLRAPMLEPAELRVTVPDPDPYSPNAELPASAPTSRRSREEPGDDGQMRIGRRRGQSRGAAEPSGRAGHAGHAPATHHPPTLSNASTPTNGRSPHTAHNKASTEGELG